MDDHHTPQPVLSRRTVNPTMAARGLRSAAELAQGKPCGTRVRYYAGCRCAACRAANAAYERERNAARRRGEHGHMVGAERAREHLAWLSRQGVGRKTAADAAKVAASTISKVIDGQRLKIRSYTERRILAVTPDAAADRSHIDGAETLRLIDELLACGYSRARLGSELLGRRVPSLQIGMRGRVHVRTAERVRRLHERLRCVPAGPALRQLRALYEEGFHRNRVARMLADLAERRGWPAVDLAVRKDLIQQRCAELVGELHRQLIEEEVAA